MLRCCPAHRPLQLPIGRMPHATLAGCGLSPAALLPIADIAAAFNLLFSLAHPAASTTTTGRMRRSPRSVLSGRAAPTPPPVRACAGPATCLVPLAGTYHMAGLPGWLLHLLDPPRQHRR